MNARLFKKKDLSVSIADGSESGWRGWASYEHDSHLWTSDRREQSFLLHVAPTQPHFTPPPPLTQNGGKSVATSLFVI